MTGSGWHPGDAIFVQIGSNSFGTDVACVLTASSDGTIAGTQANGSCQVPQVPDGTKAVVAIDDQTQSIRASGGTFAVTPVLILTPSPASPGDTMTIQGHGFAAGSTVSGFKLDSTNLTAIPSSIGTDATGSFTASVSFTLPNTTAAIHTISARDSSGHTGTGALPVVKPTLSVSPTSGQPGHGLTVSGAGWKPGDAIFIQIGSTTFDADVACVLTASNDGTIAGTQSNGSCQIPNVPAGNEPLVAIDDQQQGVRANGVFPIKPILVLSPSPASPGVTITIQGHGFAAGSTVSGFKIDAAALNTVPASVSTDGSGNFAITVSFSVPSTATAATHTISAKDSSGHAGTGLLPIFRPALSISPRSGLPGHGLTVTGHGWMPGDAIFIQIGSPTFDNDVACVLTASSDGTIAGNQTNGGCQVPSGLATGNQPVFGIDDQQQGIQASGGVFNVT